METLHYQSVETGEEKEKEKLHYQSVETGEEEENGEYTVSRKYLLRQLFVCSGIWTSYFCLGLSFGSPTVLIPQLRKEANSTDAVSTEMASWLSSAFNHSGLPSTVLLACLTRLIGRKRSSLFVCTTSLISFIIYYWSTNVTHVLISEIFQGPLMASPITTSIMVLTEYLSPRYRGVFLTLKSAIFFWGVWVANAMGTFMHWKSIAILAFPCCMYSLLTALTWPESPYWLASKNRIHECIESHRWLKGRSKGSEAELQSLIQSQRKQSAQVKPTKFHKKFGRMLKSRAFYKPVLISFSVESLYHFSGKLACSMYAIDIIKQMTETESTAYVGMLILDGITVLGMYVGCGLAKILKRRTLLLVSSTVGVLFLFCTSLYLYLIHIEVIVENSIVSISLLMCYSLAISIGPMIMSSTIIGELIPVKNRSSSVIFLGVCGNFFMGGILKISPFLLNYLRVYGLFLLFAVIESFCIIINYNVLPETKDKTLLEIQDFMCNKSNMDTKGYLKKETEHLNYEVPATVSA